MKFIRRYFKKLIHECLLEMKITSVKISHPQPDKIEVRIKNCSLISGGCCIEAGKDSQEEKE